MGIDLMLAGYDSGHENQRMGAGPERLRRVAVQALSAAAPVTVRSCHPSSAWRAELASGFEMQRVVAAHAAAALADGHAPVLISGNCNTMLGVVAAAQASYGQISVVWFDAHGDANRPEDDASGFLDGHGVSMLTGHAWQAATAVLPGFTPLPGSHLVHAGGRDFNPGEHERLIGWDVTVVDPAQLDGFDWDEALPSGLPVHLHIDLDVLDPAAVGPANSYAAPGGLNTTQLCRAVDAIAARHSLSSLSLASYDPSQDLLGGVADAARDVLRALARRLAPEGRGTSKPGPVCE